jgi:hypothetical protein
MAERTLLSVGYEIPGFSDDCVAFDSDRSLPDADVVLFQPTLVDYEAEEHYMGRRRITNDDSPRAVEHCRRWREEMTEVLRAGKTLFVFLPPFEEVYVHLGKRSVSGTGRNQKVTQFVELLTNYSVLPFDLGTIVPKGGSEIRVIGDLKQLAPYWTSFGGRSPYKVYLKNPAGTLVLTAKAPDAVVGLVVRSGKGTAILVPPVEYDYKAFTTTNRKGEAIWTKPATALGNQLVNAFLEIDRAIRADREITPAPDWVSSGDYSIAAEAGFEEEAAEKEREIERLRVERDALKAKATEVASLRDLLYESGKPLEAAILRALKAIGFAATPFHDDDSEFDAVFSAPEGRFLGEAEGKNDKAVSVDKLDQLERNIREDFARREDGSYSKGVLFGNAYRLKEPFQRPDFFTRKCYAAAARGKVALVRTTDLFPVTRYLEQTSDPDFAAKCRGAILAAEGTVVVFPPIAVAPASEPLVPSAQ